MASHTFSCIDGHTCGNPVRLVSGGGPRLEGATMLEKRAHFLREFDWIRTGLMFEPRGHDMMSGSILYPPTRPDCDVAVLFIETSGCLPMCGHGTIGTITMGIENGLITPRERSWLTHCSLLAPSLARRRKPCATAGCWAAHHGDDATAARPAPITRARCAPRMVPGTVKWAIHSLIWAGYSSALGAVCVLARMWGTCSHATH